MSLRAGWLSLRVYQALVEETQAANVDKKIHTPRALSILETGIFAQHARFVTRKPLKNRSHPFS